MPFGVGRRSAGQNLGPRAHLVKRRVAAQATRGGGTWMSASRYEERLTKLVRARSSHATVGRWRLSILSPQPTLRGGVVEPGRCDEQAMIMGPHQRVGVAQQFDARRDIYPQQT